MGCFSAMLALKSLAEVLTLVTFVCDANLFFHGKLSPSPLRLTPSFLSILNFHLLQLLFGITKSINLELSTCTFHLDFHFLDVVLAAPHLIGDISVSDLLGSTFFSIVEGCGMTGVFDNLF